MHQNHFFVNSETVLLYNIGSAFHTSLLLHFPPLHFWPYRIFHSRIFSRPC